MRNKNYKENTLKNNTTKNNTLKKNIKNVFKSLLVLLIIFSITIPTFAEEKMNKKEEVVYGMLSDDGSVKEVYVVNIFEDKGEIKDYGDYSDVRNMTSEDQVKESGNKVTANNTNAKLYYEGVLNENDLPWNISIKYYIDDKEYRAEDIAGKSGNLGLEIKTEENKKIDKFFFENYGMQITLILNTEIAKDIKAEGATIANVGKNKQLTYTILPGKGADISIEADVKDFEMEAISINGLQLNLDIDIDDAALMEKVEELLSGVNKLDKGAYDIKSGALSLNEGSNKLASGAKNLNEGTMGLDSGVSSLRDGIDQINDALIMLDSKSNDLTKGSGAFKEALKELQDSLSLISIEGDKINQLSGASSKIKSGINELNNSLKLLNESVGYDNYKEVVKEKGLDIDELKEGNEKALKTLNPIIEKLREISSKIKEYPDIPGSEYLVKEMDKQIDNLSDIASLFKGNNAAISGSELYLNEVSASISKIYKGSSDLNDSYKEFDDAITELVESLNRMVGKLPELKGAIDTLVERYGEFDNGVNDYTDGLASILVGYKEIVDGASSLNSGSSSLKSGSFMLYDNMANLLEGTSSLYKGTEDLADGTREFKDRTSNLDEEVQNEIDETLLELTGDASETISFVSSENTNVDAVQFVMKTTDIKFDGVSDEIVEVEPEKLTFWEKFIDLFSFNI